MGRKATKEELIRAGILKSPSELKEIAKKKSVGGEQTISPPQYHSSSQNTQHTPQNTQQEVAMWVTKTGEKYIGKQKNPEDILVGSVDVGLYNQYQTRQQQPQQKEIKYFAVEQPSSVSRAVHGYTRTFIPKQPPYERVSTPQTQTTTTPTTHEVISTTPTTTKSPPSSEREFSLKVFESKISTYRDIKLLEQEHLREKERLLKLSEEGKKYFEEEQQRREKILNTLKELEKQAMMSKEGEIFEVYEREDNKEKIITFTTRENLLKYVKEKKSMLEQTPSMIQLGGEQLTEEEFKKFLSKEEEKINETLLKQKISFAEQRAREIGISGLIGGGFGLIATAGTPFGFAIGYSSGISSFLAQEGVYEQTGDKQLALIAGSSIGGGVFTGFSPAGFIAGGISGFLSHTTSERIYEYTKSQELAMAAGLGVGLASFYGIMRATPKQLLRPNIYQKIAEKTADVKIKGIGTTKISEVGEEQIKGVSYSKGKYKIQTILGSSEGEFSSSEKFVTLARGGVKEAKVTYSLTKQGVRGEITRPILVGEEREPLFKPIVDIVKTNLNKKEEFKGVLKEINKKFMEDASLYHNVGEIIEKNAQVKYAGLSLSKTKFMYSISGEGDTYFSHQKGAFFSTHGKIKTQLTQIVKIPEKAYTTTQSYKPIGFRSNFIDLKPLPIYTEKVLSEVGSVGISLSKYIKNQQSIISKISTSVMKKPYTVLQQEKKIFPTREQSLVVLNQQEVERDIAYVKKQTKQTLVLQKQVGLEQKKLKLSTQQIGVTSNVVTVERIKDKLQQTHGVNTVKTSTERIYQRIGEQSNLIPLHATKTGGKISLKNLETPFGVYKLHKSTIPPFLPPSLDFDPLYGLRTRKRKKYGYRLLKHPFISFSVIGTKKQMRRVIGI